MDRENGSAARYVVLLLKGARLASIKSTLFETLCAWVEDVWRTTQQFSFDPMKL